MTCRSCLALRTELDQLRQLERYADSDLVRLALSAHAALVAIGRPDLAALLDDLGVVVSNQPRRFLRRMALACLERAVGCAGLADHWEENGRPEAVERLRLEAMVMRFKAMVLLEASR